MQDTWWDSIEGGTKCICVTLLLFMRHAQSWLCLSFQQNLWIWPDQYCLGYLRGHGKAEWLAQGHTAQDWRIHCVPTKGFLLFVLCQIVTTWGSSKMDQSGPKHQPMGREKLNGARSLEGIHARMQLHVWGGECWETPRGVTLPRGRWRGQH